MPAEQMGKVMNLFSAALGVNCNHCHSGYDFAKEGNANKDEARKMIAMTLELNRKYFADKPTITCTTCHQGKTIPDSELTFSNMPVEKTIAVTAPNRDSFKPREIIDRYVMALSRVTVTSRRLRAERIEPDGKREQEEVLILADGRSWVKTLYGPIAIVEAFDGKTVWKEVNNKPIELKPDEADQIRREGILASGNAITSSYSDLTLAGYQEIDGVEVVVVRGKSFGVWDEALYFDMETGLLVRRICSVPTLMGPFQYHVDYTEYREFDGVQIPTLVRYAMPNLRWERKIVSVEINSPIDETQFHQTATGLRR
jgi:hypothetical protein